jgi:hypothetical protein
MQETICAQKERLKSVADHREGGKLKAIIIFIEKSYG